jgi:ABC-type dipeptide/oligopeptide/nickel transport system permease component
MLTYIVRRILLMFPTLLGVTAVVFFVMALAPGGFGGSVLNQLGAQTEGEEAKRIRRNFERRYGLDKSPVEQYFRWLNQISPVGFLTSRQIELSDQAKKRAEGIIDTSTAPAVIAMRDKVRLVTLALALYLDEDAAIAAEMVLMAVNDPEAGLELLATIEPPSEKFVAEVRSLAEQDSIAAVRQIIDELGSLVAGRDSVLLGRPAIKWPNLGTSLRGRPVTELLAEAVPITLLLNVITVPLSYVVAVLIGVYAAKHRGRLFDVGSGGVMLGLWSIPVMWVGVMLIGYLANKQHLYWFPTAGLHDLQADTMAFMPRFGQEGFERGWLLDTAWHLVLPVFCMSYGGLAMLAKHARSSILENISADYVRTARAKGLDERDVLFRHVFRNSMLPLITFFAALVPSLFAGTVIVEHIFSLPGMGRLGVEAAFMKDREVVMGTTLIGSVMGLLSYLLRDIWYAMADPRVSYE